MKPSVLVDFRNIILAVLAAVLALSMPLAAQTRQTIEYGSITIEAATISLFSDAGKVVAKGKVVLTSDDKTLRTSFNAKADEMTVVFAAKKTGATGLDAIKSAEFTGPATLTYTTPKVPSEHAAVVKTTATADKIIYDGSDKKAYLTGNVKIVRDDPLLFAEPAVATGDNAMVNLKPNLGPNEVSFELRSSPGVSRIEATPAAKTEGN